jgi:hypothetical protein
MPAISPEEWLALRAEWEVGAISNLALAAKYNVSEKAIRKRAVAEGWTRAPDALAAAQSAAVTRAVLEHDDASRGPTPPPDPAETKGKPGSDPGSDRGSESSDHSDPSQEKNPGRAVSAEIRELTIDRVAEVMKVGVIRDLERIEMLEGTFGQLHRHVSSLLKVMTDGDPEVEVLEALAEGKDAIASKITAMTRLAESIQTQRRKALGMEDRPKRLELSGPGGGVIEHQHQVTQVERQLVLDFANMSTAELEAYQRLIAMMEGGTERPPIPAPPAGPDDTRE